MACLCEGGCIKREGDGQDSLLTLVYGRERSDESPHWFLRVFVSNADDGRKFADNFDVAYCPTCGREL